MKFHLFGTFLIGVVATGCLAQQPEALSFEGTAYNPIPSPDGKYVAFLLTGRAQRRGTGGFGRSNLRTEIAFMQVGRGTIIEPGVDGFLNTWQSDSQTIGSYRDGAYALAGPFGEGRHGRVPAQRAERSPSLVEPVTYIESRKQFLWLEHQNTHTLLQTERGPIGIFPGSLALSSILVPSPDGEFLAVGSQGYSHAEDRLWIYDFKNSTWTDLGVFSIHPDSEWAYTKPSWSPWSPDSQWLTFFSGSELCLVTRDGVKRRELLHTVQGGLAVFSPGGDSIAYATFLPRPRQRRPDLKFWGGTTLWTVPVAGGATVAVTQPSQSETLVLRWLNAHSLIFDRVGEGLFQEDARIWTVPVATR